MSVDSFWISGWHHVMPKEKCDSHGRREIICRLCFGPLETDIYGIENDKFYHEYHYIEGVLEGEIEFDYISREEFIKELEYEIRLSIKYKADKLTDALITIRDKLISD